MKNVSRKSIIVVSTIATVAVLSIFVAISKINKGSYQPKVDSLASKPLLPPEKSRKLQAIQKKLFKPNKMTKVAYKLKRVNSNLDRLFKKLKAAGNRKNEKRRIIESILASSYELKVVANFYAKSDSKNSKVVDEMNGVLKKIDSAYKQYKKGDLSSFDKISNSVSKKVANKNITPINFRVNKSEEKKSEKKKGASFTPRNSLESLFFEEAHATQLLFCKTKHFFDPQEPEKAGSEFLDLTDPVVSPSQDITQLALSLRTPLKMFNFVKNEVKYEDNCKLKKNARSTLDAKQGNAWEKSALLVSLLRSEGIAARFVAGEIMVSQDQLSVLYEQPNVFGVSCADFSEFAPGQARITSGGKTYYRLHHIWVEAFIPFDETQGVGVQTASKAWAPLDPTFVEREVISHFGTQSGINTTLTNSSSFLFSADDYLLEKNPETDSHIKQSTPDEIISENIAQLLSDAQASNKSWAIPLSEYVKRSRKIKVKSEGLALGPMGAEACIDGKYAKLPDLEKLKIKIIGPGIEESLAAADYGEDVLFMTFRGATQSDEDKLDQVANGTLSPTGANIQGKTTLYYGGDVVAQGPLSTFGAFGRFEIITEEFSRSGELIVENGDPREGPNGINSLTYAFLNDFSVGSPIGYEKKIDDFLNSLEGVDIESLSFFEKTKISARSMQLALITLNRNAVSQGMKIAEVSGTRFSRPRQPAIEMWSGYSPQKFFDRSFGFIPQKPVVSWVESSNFGLLHNTFGVPLPAYRSAQEASNVGGSVLEHKIFEEFFSIDGQSTIKVIQTAKDLGLPVLKFEVTPLNKSSTLAQLTGLTPEFVTSLSELLTSFEDQGTLVIPNSQVQIGAREYQVYHLRRGSSSANILGIAFGGEGGEGFADSGTGWFTDDFSSAFPDFEFDPGDVNSVDFFDDILSGGDFELDFLNGPSIDFGSCFGAPVNLSNGGMWHQFEDIPVIDGPRPRLRLQRMYQAKSNYNGPLGQGWSHTFNQRIELFGAGSLDYNQEQTILFFDESNQEIKIVFKDGKVITPPWQRVKAEKLNGDYVITKLNKDVLRFHGSGQFIGKIKSITSRHGNVLSYEYDPSSSRLNRVVDPVGRSLTFQYNASGKLERVSDFTGRFVEFEYDARGDLSVSKNLDGENTTYTYLFGEQNPELNHNMSSFRDPEGNGVDYFYYENDKVFKHIEPEGKLSQFAYNTFDKETIVYDGKGNQFKYQYDIFGNVRKKINPDNTFTANKWDVYRNKVEVQDEEGFKTKFKSDSRGNTIEIEPPSPFGKSLFAYHPEFNTPTRTTDGNGNKVDFVIDDQTGDVLSRTEYTETSGGSPLVTQFLYSSDGRTRQVTDAKNNVTSISRSRDGQFVETVVTENALGDTMTQVFDPLGRMVKEIDFNGRVTDLSYDNFNNVTRREIVGSGLVEEFVHDKVGRRLQAKRIADGSELVTASTYDGLGNITSSTNELGEITKFVHQTDSCLCGIEGQVKSIVDPKGNKTSFDYDFRGNVISIVDSQNAKTLISYDSRGNRRQVKTLDASGKELFSILFETGALGEVSRIREKFPVSYQTLSKDIYKSRVPQLYSETFSDFTYDSAGNLTRKKVFRTWTGEEDSIDFAYNGLNLVKTKTTRYESNSEVTSYEYDLNKNLEKLSNVHSLLEMDYDKINRLKSVSTKLDPGRGIRQPETTLNYFYDKTTNVVRVEDESAQEIYSNGYDGVARLASVSSKGLSFGFSYDGFQRMSQINYPNGLATSLSYDSKNQVRSISTPGFSSLSYQYDKNGNIRSLMGDRGQWDYGYNSRDELINSKYVGSRGLSSEQFIWDAAGNDISGRSLPNNSSISARPLIMNNALIEDGQITNDPNHGVGRFALRYDFKGNVIEKYDNVENIHYFYKFDSENRMREATKADGSNNFLAKLEYRYDGLGRRIEKESTAQDGSTRRKSYIYDRDNILLEYDKDGNKVGSFIGTGRIDDPLMLIRDEKPYFYHKDHLGSIIGLSDETGEVIQQNFYSSFGEIEKVEDGQGGGLAFGGSSAPVDSPYYFTGREYDSEVGVHYYRARYYDSAVKKFLSVDPSGIDADIHLFRYADNNPLVFVDPLGNDSIQIGISGSAFVGVIGGNVETGVAVTRNEANGEIQIGGFFNFESRFGVGLSAGVGVAVTLSPDVQNLSDLEGIATSFGTDLGPISLQQNFLLGEGGQRFNSTTITGSFGSGAAVFASPVSNTSATGPVLTCQ